MMVTILDSHPDIAMSYELYPNLLELEDGSPEGLSKAISRLDPTRGRRYAEDIANTKLATFLNRLPRGGLEPADVLEVINSHVSENAGVRTVEERLRLVERLARWKARREDKGRWGLKCLNNYADYLSVFPDASFINMVRDGRDVFASQLTQMSRVADVEAVARAWVRTNQQFREFASQSGVPAEEVIYEQLVRDPESELRKLCVRLGLSFYPSMAKHQEQPHTVYSASHLSLARIKQPIDTASIGRWREDLTPDQVAGFMAIAGDMMEAYGYTMK